MLTVVHPYYMKLQVGCILQGFQQYVYRFYTKWLQ